MQEIPSDGTSEISRLVNKFVPLPGATSFFSYSNGRLAVNNSSHHHRLAASDEGRPLLFQRGGAVVQLLDPGTSTVTRFQLPENTALRNALPINRNHLLLTTDKG